MKSALALVLAAVLGCGAGAAAIRKSPTAQRVILHSGTLIIVMPTKDGVVVAADSRGFGSDGSIDDTERKIVQSNRLPVAAFATGTTTVFLPGDASNPRPNVDYDVYALLRRELDGLSRLPDSSDFRRIVTLCGQVILHSRAADAGQLKEHYIQIGLVTFDPMVAKSKTYIARLFVDARNVMTADFDPVVDSGIDSAGTLGVYGEGEYLQTQVLNGSGRSLLSREANQFLNVKSTVGAQSSVAAYAIAKNLIQAVGRSMADNHVARATVGGPTRAVLVGPSGVQTLQDDAPSH